jgi:hypothetical protein
MPILLIALLALLVFGLIGIVLAIAMVSEHSKLRPFSNKQCSFAPDPIPLLLFI